MPTTIGELAKTVGFRGTMQHRLAEPSYVRTLPIIDNSSPVASNVRTSVDCYVSGQYVSRTGNVIEVTQRYTIFVSYHKGTQVPTLNQVRDRIMADFEAKYGSTFNVTNVFVPLLPVPKSEVLPGVGKGTIGDMYLYGGSNLFRAMTSYEKARHEIGTQKQMAKTNIGNIRQRYGLKR